MFAYFTLAGDAERQHMQLSGFSIVRKWLVLQEWVHAYDPVDPKLMQEEGFNVVGSGLYHLPLSKLDNFTINEED